MFRPPKPKEEEKKPEAAKETAHKSDEKPQQIITRGGGGVNVTRGLLTAADIVTAIKGGTWNIDNLLNPHPISISSPLTGGKVDIRALIAADKVTVDNLLNPHPVSLATLLNPHPVTQLTRTNLLTKPEREDLISLGGVVSPNNAGVQIVAGSTGKYVKVYDGGFHGAADGLHYFYFGTTTTATTKRFCSINLKGVIHKTFVQPRIGASGDGLYLFSSVSETNMPYDVGYVQE